MISGRVTLDRTGWSRDMQRRIEARIPDLLREAAEDGAVVASAGARARTRTGEMQKMEILPVVKTPRGYTGGFKSKAFYAGFQSRGTKRGVTALGFLERGLAEARRSLDARMKRLT